MLHVQHYKLNIMNAFINMHGWKCKQQVNCTQLLLFLMHVFFFLRHKRAVMYQSLFQNKYVF